LLLRLSSSLLTPTWSCAICLLHFAAAFNLLLLLPAAAFLQFFADTEVELRRPRPGGFPASGIWGYRIANVALNLLNYWWCVWQCTGSKRSRGSSAWQAVRPYSACAAIAIVALNLLNYWWCVYMGQQGRHCLPGCSGPTLHVQQLLQVSAGLWYYLLQCIGISIALLCFLYA
jgi:hypothetical protein